MQDASQQTTSRCGKSGVSEEGPRGHARQRAGEGFLGGLMLLACSQMEDSRFGVLAWLLAALIAAGGLISVTSTRSSELSPSLSLGSAGSEAPHAGPRAGRLQAVPTGPGTSCCSWEETCWGQGASNDNSVLLSQLGRRAANHSRELC